MIILPALHSYVWCELQRDVVFWKSVSQYFNNVTVPFLALGSDNFCSGLLGSLASLGKKFSKYLCCDSPMLFPWFGL